jgi:hypothetical protein
MQAYFYHNIKREIIMKFGGLSEKEADQISRILTKENVSFKVIYDDDIDDFNRHSIKNNLRHLSPPSISTHTLAIVINDEDFNILSAQCRSDLLPFGIGDQPPDFLNIDPVANHSIHKDLIEGQKRALGFNLKHQLFLLVFIFAIISLIRFFAGI